LTNNNSNNNLQNHTAECKKNFSVSKTLKPPLPEDSIVPSHISYKKELKNPLKRKVDIKTTKNNC
jgi:hypothetical protein